MRKTTLIAFMLMAVLAGAQNWDTRVQESNPDNNSNLERKYFQLGAEVDFANAFIGGKRLESGERRNKQALDLVIRPAIGFQLTENIPVEIGISVELFPTIDYYSLGIDFNYAVPFTRTLIGLVGVEGALVGRYGIDAPPRTNNKTEHFVPGANFRFRWENVFGTRFFIGSRLSYKYRTDIGYLYGENEIPKFKDSFNGSIEAGVKF